MAQGLHNLNLGDVATPPTTAPSGGLGTPPATAQAAAPVHPAQVLAGPSTITQLASEPQLPAIVITPAAQAAKIRKLESALADALAQVPPPPTEPQRPPLTAPLLELFSSPATLAAIASARESPKKVTLPGIIPGFKANALSSGKPPSTLPSLRIRCYC